MGLREALTRLAIAGTAIGAAFLARPAAHPEDVHGPGPYDAFLSTARRLPVLDAVAVRDAPPTAAGVLASRRGPLVAEVLDPRRAYEVFSYGGLLYADVHRLEEVLATLRRGDPPEDLPAAPDLDPWFRDAQGEIVCEALLHDPEDPEGVRHIAGVLPGARLTGEPVAREIESRRESGIVRAILAALGIPVLLAGVRARRRRGTPDTGAQIERRLLAALGALLAVGAAGLGVDAAVVLALALVFGAPGGPVLLLGAPAVAFGPPALRAVGLVLGVGGLLRLEPRRARAALGALSFAPHRFAAACAAGGALAIAAWLVSPPGHAPDVVRTGKAASIGPRLDSVADLELLPPPLVAGERSRLLGAIEREAARLASSARDPATREAFLATVRAAGMREPYLPRALAARLVTEDDHRVVWRPTGEVADDPAFTGAGLYRERGDARLRRDALRAAGIAVALLLLAGAAGAFRPVTPARAVTIALALLCLARAEDFDPVIGWPCASLLLVVVAARPDRGWTVPLLAAGVALPSALAWPAGALLVALAPAWLEPRALAAGGEHGAPPREPSRR